LQLAAAVSVTQVRLRLSYSTATHHDKRAYSGAGLQRAAVLLCIGVAEEACICGVPV